MPNVLLGNGFRESKLSTYMRLSQREFEEIVAEALDGIPEEIAENLSNISVIVEAWPSPETLEDVGLSDRYELLGLYEGVPLTDRGTYYGEVLPDRISIFQGPIEAVAHSKLKLREEIRKVVVHEIAHHIGIGEERLRELGY